MLFRPIYLYDYSDGAYGNGDGDGAYGNGGSELQFRLR